MSFVFLTSFHLIQQPIDCCVAHDVEKQQSVFTVVNETKTEDLCEHNECADSVYFDLINSLNNVNDTVIGCSTSFQVSNLRLLL